MTKPEAININHLKRLLVQMIDDIKDMVEAETFHEEREIRARLVRNIENAILNGDDS